MAEKTKQLKISADESASYKGIPKLLEGLNAEQKAAVEHRDGPLLIVAGAGTGKTTVITRRIAYLIEQGAKPEEILAVAFGEKAAAEMEERVDQLLPIGYYNLQISTFHAFGEQVLREYGIEIGLPDFKILNEVGQWVLIRNNLDKFDLDYYRPLGNPTRFIKALVSHFSRAKDELITPEEYLDYAERLRLGKDTPHPGPLPQGEREGEGDEIARVQEVANAYHTYQKLMLDAGALDFGDLINYTLKLFKDRPQVLEFYRKRFKYIMVDEFQDTNFAQYELVRLLASPGNNLVVVGDDDQSIFKFRGASISNILHFQKDYKNAKFINLTRNYRSKQNILDTAYEFIKLNNPDRLEEKLGISKRLVSEADKSARYTKNVEQIVARDYIDEAERVIEEILTLKNNNPGLTWNDFAILARSHDALESFIGKLEQHDLPYIYFANKGLYRKPLILDLVAYFKLLDNYHESAAMYRVLNFPLFDIDYKTIMEIAHHAKKKNLSFYESAKQAATLLIGQKNLLGINRLLTLLERHQELARTKTAAQVFVEVIRDLDFRKIISKNSSQGLQNAKFIETFFRHVQDFQNEPAAADKSLKTFLDQLRLEQEAGELGSVELDVEAGPEAIKLITVHGAKGLEYSYVFVVGLVDKRFPTIERHEPIELPEPLIKDILPVGDIHLEEERRLFYVAMTRAKDGLFLTRAIDYGGKRTKKASRFLIELGLAQEEKAKSTGEVEFSTATSPQPSPPKAERERGWLPIPNTFSFSEISTFRSCPLKYKYRYILRLPEPGTAALSFGVTIHQVLEKFLKYYQQNIGHQDLFGQVKGSPDLPAFGYLLKLYEELWIGDWYDNKKQMEDYKKLGRKILENYYDYTEQHKPRPKYIEKGFRMKVDGSYLSGKLDRADESPDGLLIIDYKTGQPKTKLSPVDKEQLLLYQWAARDFFKEKVAGLQYWYLKGNLEEGETFLGSESDLLKLQKNLLGTIAEIKLATAADDFLELDRRMSGHSECDYRELEL